MAMQTQSMLNPDHIPSWLRNRVRRPETPWPVRETRLHAREMRGLRFGSRMAYTHNGAGAAFAPSRDRNRLERYFDTHTVGPGIEKWRHYFDIYDRHFAKFVGREVYVVEIGISSGGSLAMWLDYFGAGCHVYGVDIDPACKVHEAASIRVRTGDQGDPRFWTWFLREVPRIDILIDDGGHRAREQIVTFESVFEHLQPGGVYLCEDAHGTSNAFNGYISGLARNLHAWEGTSTTSFQKMVGAIHVYPFVTVIERPDSALLELPAQRRGTQWRPGL
jgi:hypothetical protein